MAAGPHLSSPDRTGRAALAVLVLCSLLAFLWVVANLATAAFGG